MDPIREVTFDKTYDASLDAVWKAWTDPEALKQWWGPDNVIIPECEFDPKVGGRFYIVMEAGEAMGPYKGTRWPMEATFTTVDEHSKIAYSAKAWTEGQDGMTFEQETEITFAEENGKTKIHVRAAGRGRGGGARGAGGGGERGGARRREERA